ncbi:MAG: thioredoxin domain-containing protein [Candidatus Komeilibacteria bacterium]|nr:thioredoxin domain-containing protein [Candidatus Komeilibacteria bacterium]
MNIYTSRPKHHIWKWLLIILGTLILLYAIYFVYTVLTIRSQILSGNYNFEQYGSDVSGQASAEIDTRKYQVATTDDPALGAEGSKVTIVEFGDFQCPFCRQAYTIIRSLAARFPNDIRVIYRDFPLSDDHLVAELAARAGYCAHEQGLFWPFHDKAFHNQDNLSREVLIDLAVQSGIEPEKFLVCLDSQTASEEVKEDIREGKAAGVVGTPTWFVNGYRVAGVIPQNILEKIIQELIK